MGSLADAIRDAAQSLKKPTDAMNPQSQKAYKDATGAAIDAPQTPAPPVQAPAQQVQPVDPNIEGLAALLVRTGRAPTLDAARGMANSMTKGNK